MSHRHWTVNRDYWCTIRRSSLKCINIQINTHFYADRSVRSSAPGRWSSLRVKAEPFGWDLSSILFLPLNLRLQFYCTKTAPHKITLAWATHLTMPPFAENYFLRALGYPLYENPLLRALHNANFRADKRWQLTRRINQKFWTTDKRDVAKNLHREFHLCVPQLHLSFSESTNKWESHGNILTSWRLMHNQQQHSAARYWITYLITDISAGHRESLKAIYHGRSFSVTAIHFVVALSMEIP